MACNMQRKLQVVIVVSVFVACAAGMAMTHLSMSPSEYKRNWLIFVGVPLLCILLVGTSIIIMFMETSSNNNHVVRVKSPETPEARCVWAPSRYDMLQSMSPQFCCVHIESGAGQMLYFSEGEAPEIRSTWETYKAFSLIGLSVRIEGFVDLLLEIMTG
ncbi:unnamed protein product [Symbiodinium sp. KB8]|nr:unnamed protein product [Symbiodinium sp. KB8]